MTRGANASNVQPAGFRVAIANQQTRHPVNHEQLCDAVRAVLTGSQFDSADISIAVVDDASMQELNRRYLDHDWPTDVLSFVLEEAGNHLEGEIILSADTAAQAASEVGWPAAAEQLLYAIHGTLHLIGYRDTTPVEVQQMRAAEARYLRQFGFELTAADEQLKSAESAVTTRGGGATAR